MQLSVKQREIYFFDILSTHFWQVPKKPSRYSYAHNLTTMKRDEKKKFAHPHPQSRSRPVSQKKMTFLLKCLSKRNTHQ